MNVSHIMDKLGLRLGSQIGLDRVEACLQTFARGVPPTPTHPLHEATRVYFPGLTARPWYERQEFSWIPAFEARTRAIGEELNGLLATNTPFHPYEDPYTLELGWRGWDTLTLYRKGKQHQANTLRCPETAAALAATPHGPRQGMFSRLAPGTHLEPHSGGVNMVLTAHLGLVIPEACAIRVGGETRTWKAGEVLVFDDSFVHEAWNQGTGDRMVLLWDLWHPDLTEIEINALTLVFSSFDQIMRHLGG